MYLNFCSGRMHKSLGLGTCLEGSGARGPDLFCVAFVAYFMPWPLPRFGLNIFYLDYITTCTIRFVLIFTNVTKLYLFKYVDNLLVLLSKIASTDNCKVTRTKKNRDCKHNVLRLQTCLKCPSSFVWISSKHIWVW